MVTPAISFLVDLTAAQTEELWNTSSHGDALKLLARIAKLSAFDDEPCTTIWVEFMYQTLLFGKENQLSIPKTLAFFVAMNATHAAAVGASMPP